MNAAARRAVDLVAGRDGRLEVLVQVADPRLVVDRRRGSCSGAIAWNSDPELYPNTSVMSPVDSRVLTMLSPSVPPGRVSTLMVMSGFLAVKSLASCSAVLDGPAPGCRPGRYSVDLAAARIVTGTEAARAAGGQGEGAGREDGQSSRTWAERHHDLQGMFLQGICIGAGSVGQGQLSSSTASSLACRASAPGRKPRAADRVDQLAGRLRRGTARAAPASSASSATTSVSLAAATIVSQLGSWSISCRMLAPAGRAGVSADGVVRGPLVAYRDRPRSVHFHQVRRPAPATPPAQ